MKINNLFMLNYSGHVYTLDDAVERTEEEGLALEWDIFRPADYGDMMDYTECVVSALGDWLAESDLAHCDGGPSLHRHLSPERAALRAALAAYLRAHVDLSDAALRPLGWGVLIHPDGRVEWPPIQQALLDCARAWRGDVDVEFTADGIELPDGVTICPRRLGDDAWIAQMWIEATRYVSVAHGATSEDAIRALAALAPEATP